MYIERRPTDENKPQVWAERLVRTSRLTWLRRLRLRTDPRFALIRRYMRAPILDAGCGMGDWVAFLSSQRLEAWGLDYSAEMIEANQRIYPESGWILGTLQSIPLADGSVNGVISWGVIEHDPAGPGEAIREFRRVLRPGGTVIATVPVDSEPQRAASQAQFSGDGLFFQHFYTEQELASEFEREGFSVLELGPCSRPHPALVWPTLYAKHPRLRRALLYPAWGFPRRYANMIACTAQKPE